MPEVVEEFGGCRVREGKTVEDRGGEGGRWGGGVDGEGGRGKREVVGLGALLDDSGEHLRGRGGEAGFAADVAGLGVGGGFVVR